MHLKSPVSVSSFVKVPMLSLCLCWVKSQMKGVKEVHAKCDIIWSSKTLSLWFRALVMRLPCGTSKPYWEGVGCSEWGRVVTWKVASEWRADNTAKTTCLSCSQHFFFSNYQLLWQFCSV